ncbi:thioredoxin-like 1-1, chloroplastic [Dorcoceras hygrometricum]|uniref:Thioredoxin-like 1-1, chloroplastic n=1 Tax=Dorcoceras hygrometricum TaxID=472368 RepID=A0A2Z7DB96_9LAMI|nr:thioredoxin-like 1-1, chloroplastic [Dorcoceras hygrometricum]
MSSCLNPGFSISGPSETIFKNRAKGPLIVCSSFGRLQFKETKSYDFLGITLDSSDQKSVTDLMIKISKNDPLTVNAQASSFMSKALKWWEKSLQPNMIEINSAQEFVDYLSNAGDKLVVVDFYSPGCGICQMAELNPDTIFLMVNYEQHKPMCYALHVHVLPFFRFYRGAEGRLCSFSCTNATINKFKAALAKHKADRCSLGPTKGLNESELLALASNDLISREMLPTNLSKDNEAEVPVLQENLKAGALSKDDGKIKGDALLAV